AAQNQEEIIKYLISKGANVYSIDKDGATPLHYATSAGNREALKCLLLNGANVNARDTLSFTPLYIAIKSGFTDLVDDLLQFNADINLKYRGDTVMHIAAEQGDVKTIQYLLNQNNLKLKMQNNSGNTPFLVMRKLECIKVLLQSCTHTKEEEEIINSRNYNGENMFHLAAKEGRIDIVFLIAKHISSNLCRIMLNTK